MLVFTNAEGMAERNQAAGSGGLWMLPGAEELSGVRMRPMDDVDLERVQELRSVVRWAADPRAFDLLRGMREARWAVAEASDGSLAGMVGAVPSGGSGSCATSPSGTTTATWASACVSPRGPSHTSGRRERR